MHQHEGLLSRQARHKRKKVFFSFCEPTIIPLGTRMRIWWIGSKRKLAVWTRRATSSAFGSPRRENGKCCKRATLGVTLRKFTSDLRFRMNSVEPRMIEPPRGGAIRQDVECIENLTTPGL